MKDTTEGMLAMLILMISGASIVGLIFWITAVCVWRYCTTSAPWWYCLWIVVKS